jgi:hypothetical protein
VYHVEYSIIAPSTAEFKNRSAFASFGFADANRQDGLGEVHSIPLKAANLGIAFAGVQGQNQGGVNGAGPR